MQTSNKNLIAPKTQVFKESKFDWGFSFEQVEWLRNACCWILHILGNVIYSNLWEEFIYCKNLFENNELNISLSFSLFPWLNNCQTAGLLKKNSILILSIQTVMYYQQGSSTHIKEPEHLEISKKKVGDRQEKMKMRVETKL